MSKVDLRVDWCSHEAAKFAVEHWHYSHTMPKSKLAKFGAWEDGEFIGTIIYGVGATGDLVKGYGLDKIEGCELVRVALRKHSTPVSKLVAISLRMLKKAQPGLRLVVSFADPEHGHVGGIYQAGNWVFAGTTMASDEYIVNGKRWHGRAFRASKPAHLTTKQAAAVLDPNFQTIKGSVKYRYLYPLDDAMRKQIEPLRQPYPKREQAAGAADVAPDDQSGEGGLIPTPPLHFDSDIG